MLGMFCKSLRFTEIADAWMRFSSTLRSYSSTRGNQDCVSANHNESSLDLSRSWTALRGDVTIHTGRVDVCADQS